MYGKNEFSVEHYLNYDSVASNQQLFILVGSEILYQMVILHVTKSWSYSVILYEFMCFLI